MPKADATGLAPEKSAYLNPRPFTGAGGSSLLAAAACPFLWWSLGAEALGNQTRRPPKGRSKFSGW